MIYEDSTKDINTESCIKEAIFSSMNPEFNARTDINNENSLICPNLTPDSFEIDFFSPSKISKDENTNGFNTTANKASTIAGK